MPPKSNVAGDAGLATRPSLAFKRRLNASPEKVYAAWTDPEKIVRWFGRTDAKAELVSGEYRRPGRRTLSRQLLHR